MNQLLSRILDAHGGVDCWRDYEGVEATIVAGGGFFFPEGNDTGRIAPPYDSVAASGTLVRIAEEFKPIS
jgi:hypothetical protein